MCGKDTLIPDTDRAQLDLSLNLVRCRGQAPDRTMLQFHALQLLKGYVLYTGSQC